MNPAEQSSVSFSVAEDSEIIEITATDQQGELRLGELIQNRITMKFEYWRHGELVARGEQQVACMQREGERVVPVPVPAQLREALREYARD